MGVLHARRRRDRTARRAPTAYRPATGQATFETEVPAWEAWDAARLPDLRLVALDGDAVIGWTALSGVSERCVYSGVAEESVYVAGGSRGRGVGQALLEELIRRSELAGIWTIQTGIFQENDTSVRLHERVGFRAQLDDACPVVPGKRYVNWNLPDPKNQPLEAVRAIRDEIASRIDSLVEELDSEPAGPPR